MSLNLDEYSQACIQYLKQLDSNACMLDLGAAYGIASSSALREKKELKVYSNDLEPKHLDELYRTTSDLNRKKLHLLPGNFLHLQLPSNFFDAILVSRVLHFFSPEEIIQALKLIHTWLKKEGKLFIITGTPYLKDWMSFAPIFEDRKRQSHPWPGFIDNPTQYRSSTSRTTPSKAHFFDPDTLTQLLENYGFVVEKCGYISRDDFPEDIRNDGREGVGCIASILHGI